MPDFGRSHARHEWARASDATDAAHYKIPLIFITAHASDREARDRALEAGAVDVLYKPFKEEVLLKHVYAALLGTRAEDRSPKQTGSDNR